MFMVEIRVYCGLPWKRGRQKMLQLPILGIQFPDSDSDLAVIYVLLGKIPDCVSCICVRYSLIIALIVHVLFQLRIPWRTITLYPFMLHSISMSLFASVIGPFGGFFASGFKRAFKIKVSAALYIHVPFRLRNRTLRRILRQWLQVSLQNKGRCCPLYPCPSSPPSSAPSEDSSPAASSEPSK